jgi:hypothetical protein
MPLVIKVTHTYTHGIDEEKLAPLFNPEAHGDLAAALSLGGGPKAREVDGWLIEMFEKHEGSMYGEELFPGLADDDDDRGLELEWREEDD